MGIFRFKQFVIDQSDCAMRINTDGVLLGASASADAPKRILDIGTGTGVIALMLAQRFPLAQITAIEIDEMSAARADINFTNAIFANRLTCINQDFLSFHSAERYDLIVSNPPFFTNDLKNSDVRKGIARHTNDAFFEKMICKSVQMMQINGVFSIVLPPHQLVALKQVFEKYGLFMCKALNLCSFDGQLPFRQIASFTNRESSLEAESLILYDRPGVHSAAYRSLLKDFFMAF